MSHARRYHIILLLPVLLLISCTKQERYYTQEELQVKTDSIVRSKMEKLQQAASEDFNRRLPIELKVKLDSIFQVSYDLPPPPRLPAGADNGTSSARPETPPTDSSNGS